MDRSKRITMIDVAKMAEVSHQTVSRVINDDPRVAPETRERILKIIQELNYRPSRIARSLAARQSRTLAVITYGLSYYGPTQMVINIEKAARDAGYDISFANIDPSDESEVLAIADRIHEWSVDGALLIAPVADAHYTDMLAQLGKMPVLQIDIAPHTPTPSVIIDQTFGSYQITKHLIELGHRQIAEIHGLLNWHGALARHDGFMQALNEAHLTPSAMIEGNWTAESGYQAVQNLLSQTSFTALVVANDQMALGAMRCLFDAGLRVPEDVSVVGFDDIPEAQFFSPRLTTVRQDFSALGRTGLETLIAMIEQPTITQSQVVIQPLLIVRDSTQARS